MKDYWTSLIARWADRTLRSYGYEEHNDEAIYKVTELTTNETGFFHYQEIDKMCNLVIPNDGILYKFLMDKNYRVANCVFKFDPLEEGLDTMEFFKINNYGKALETKDYIVFKNISMSALDGLDICELLEPNRMDLDKFREPKDILTKLKILFGL